MDDLKAQQKRIKRISREARTASDLVARLNRDQENERAKARAQSKKAVLKIPKSYAGSGKPQAPLSGIMKLSYNEPDAFGAPSKGIEIEARSGSLIVAPMNGIIRFAGHFKNYGNMVIIEHEKGYHSLIAGFEKIDTVVGQSVSVGEPLGKLHFARTNAKKPTLYYELRYNGQPINPAKKFAGLS